jgi:hypothetical protein
MSTGYYIFVAISIVGVFFIWKKCMALQCRYCMNDCTFFKKLPKLKQQDIISYFLEYERRKASLNEIFTCQRCSIVYDDFSGESKSREVGIQSFRLRSRNFKPGNRTFCKVCSQMMYQCEPENKNIRCPDCKTQYEWKNYNGTELLFLQPKKFTKLLEYAHKDGGAG